ncbi:MAG: hypothetical protein EHM42_06735 [Planctomycetaceae bacterium]|nr:MAG: hypothetical protein EHM42_06735 [Planctomycetaceae bacterium]
MPKQDPFELAEAIKKKSPSFEADGRRFYIVERDIQLEESELLSYAERLLAVEPPAPAEDNPYGLVAATIDGKPMRWKVGTVLRWSVDAKSFPKKPMVEQVAKLARAASGDWNAAATSAKLKISFAEAESGQSPVFRFQFENFSDPNLYAVAFFPNDPAFKRVVRVGPTMLKTGAQFDPVGVLRHELGHVLGFRHEHIRPEAPRHIESWVVGTIGAQVLTNYDPRSLMHYPMTPGYGTTDFRLTDRDKEGLAALYRMKASAVREFSP